MHQVKNHCFFTTLFPNPYSTVKWKQAKVLSQCFPSPLKLYAGRLVAKTFICLLMVKYPRYKGITIKQRREPRWGVKSGSLYERIPYLCKKSSFKCANPISNIPCFLACDGNFKCHVWMKSCCFCVTLCEQNLTKPDWESLIHHFLTRTSGTVAVTAAVRKRGEFFLILITKVCHSLV